MDPCNTTIYLYPKKGKAISPVGVLVHLHTRRGKDTHYVDVADTSQNLVRGMDVERLREAVYRKAKVGTATRHAFGLLSAVISNVHFIVKNLPDETRLEGQIKLDEILHADSKTYAIMFSTQRRR
ncbi:MAG: hypothetical protein Q7R95_02580 [bacterium]|nr:hypothetical protein [bacterium]